MRPHPSKIFRSGFRQVGLLVLVTIGFVGVNVEGAIAQQFSDDIDISTLR